MLTRARANGQRRLRAFERCCWCRPSACGPSGVETWCLRDEASVISAFRGLKLQRWVSPAARPSTWLSGRPSGVDIHQSSWRAGKADDAIRGNVQSKTADLLKKSYSLRCELYKPFSEAEFCGSAPPSGGTVAQLKHESDNNKELHQILGAEMP